MKPTIISATNDADFIAQGVTWINTAITESTSARGRTILGLSGGSTPKPIYEVLGKSAETSSSPIDWSKVWIFLVDDRYIRADDPNSNQFLLRSTLLKNAAIPESQIIFPDTSLPLSECVQLYGKYLKDLLKKGPPDLITLGMGDDGHIASLFPPLSDAAFGPGLAIHTVTDKFAVKDRISVTLPVLEQARQSVFFLKGNGKKRVWDEMMTGSEDERRWPAKALSRVTAIAQWRDSFTR